MCCFHIANSCLFPATQSTAFPYELLQVGHLLVYIAPVHLTLPHQSIPAVRNPEVAGINGVVRQPRVPELLVLDTVLVRRRQLDLKRLPPQIEIVPHDAVRVGLDARPEQVQRENEREIGHCLS